MAAVDGKRTRVEGERDGHEEEGEDRETRGKDEEQERGELKKVIALDKKPRSDTLWRAQYSLCSNCRDREFTLMWT